MTAVAKTLRVLMSDNQIGVVTRPGGNLRFEYDADWQINPRGIPLSRSMPIQQRRHTTRIVTNFMWGLLPDNERVLEEWARRFQVSARNPFALLASAGEDCPGAVQLAPPGLELRSREGVARLSRRDFEGRIVALRNDPGAGRMAGDSGQFSLAGAQVKTALYRFRNGWGIPQGRTPTTHILKPENGRIKDIAANEHFCLRLARRLAMPAVTSEVETIAGVQVIIVERYDRIRRPNAVFRIHQEDMCQALGVNPFRKYQQDGGPTIKHIMSLLLESAAPDADRDRFMRAQAFNYAIAGTDAHARNYSIVYAPGGAFRLAPLYDIVSNLPYGRDRRAGSLAMAIDGRRVLGEILPRHWEQLAADTDFEPERTLAHVRDIVARGPDEAAALHAECRATGLSNATLDRLVAELAQRCKRLAKSYGAEAMSV